MNSIVDNIFKSVLHNMGINGIFGYLVTARLTIWFYFCINQWIAQIEKIMKILGIIPSRYNSSRFPGKPLAEIMGKTMVQRVYEQASKSEKLDKVIIATDDKSIFEHVQDFGAEAIMTSPKHENGTSRCWEAYEKYGKKFDFIINIQGDEPFLKPKQINLLADALTSKEAEITTLVKKIEAENELFDPGTVKVVFDVNHKAIYFSRSTIPFLRDTLQSQWLDSYDFFKHLGIYGYRADVLEKIQSLKTSPLEKAESLEQLKWLENGYKIIVTETDLDSHGIDTPEDLEHAIRDLELKKID